MRSLLLSFTALVALGIAPAFAQNAPMQAGELPAPPQHVPVVRHPTNITPRDTRSIISPALPQPPVGPNADATEYLHVARHAVERGQLGMAQAALGNAETYLLNRSVPYGTANQPDQRPAITNIQQALHALAAGDRSETVSLIDQTIPMARHEEMAMREGGPMANGPGPMNGGEMGHPGMAGGPPGTMGAPPPAPPPPATH